MLIIRLTKLEKKPAAEQQLIMEGYEKFQNFISTKGYTAKTSITTEQGWQKIADKLHA